MIRFLEQARHSLAPYKQYVLPKRWRKARELNAQVSEDLRKIAPYFAAQPEVPSSGKTVLFASFVNLPHTLKFEALFSRLLGARGWKSASVLDIYNHLLAARYHGDLLGNATIRIPDFIAWGDFPRHAAAADACLAQGQPAVMAFTHKESLVGMSALSSASAADGSGSFDLANPIHAERVRTLIIRSCLYTDACDRILETYKPSLVMAPEKGGVGASELFFQCLRRGVDFVQWSGCHEPESLMFKRYHKGNVRNHPFSVSAASWALMLAKPWNEDLRRAVIAQFEEGYGGNKWFQYKKLTDHTSMAGKAEIVERFKLDPAKPIAVIFSHILNDANLFYGEDLFKGGFREWLVESVRAASANPNVNWVLKLHPANTYRRANMGYTGEFGELVAIREALGGIPSNLAIVYPTDPVNPLSWFQNLDFAITVRGTVGAEIPCFGKRVLTAGTGRYSGLGFTDDSSSAAEYLGKLGRLQTLPPFTEEATRLALRHAYMFFKVRPASYRSFAHDVFEHPQGHLFNRDIRFTDSSFRQAAANPRVSRLVDWLTASRDEDFLDW